MTPEEIKAKEDAEYSAYLKQSQEDAEYQQYLSSTSSGPKQPKLEESTAEKQSVPSMLVDKLSHALDYPAGIVRTGIAKSVDELTGLKFTKPSDFSQAIEGNAPRTSQMLINAGLPDDWITQLGGFAGDVVTDPLTYMSAGASAIKRLGQTPELLNRLKEAVGPTVSKAGEFVAKGANTILNPIETYQKSAAEKLYGKAFKDINTISKAKNKPQMVSSILKNEGFSGNLKSAANKVSEINQSAGEKIGGILKEASDQGASVDILKELTPSMEFASELRKRAYPEATDLANMIDNRVQYALDKTDGVMRADEANQLKSQINKLIKESGFAQGTDAALSTQARKAIATDLSVGVKNSVKEVSPELKKELEKYNDLYSSTSEAIQKKMSKMGEAEKGFSVSPWDVGVMSAGALSGVMHNPTAAAWLVGLEGGKLGAQAARTTLGRTSRAKAYSLISDKAMGLQDPMARQALWNLMLQQKQKEEKK